jgi:hypothetical protein
MSDRSRSDRFGHGLDHMPSVYRDTGVVRRAGETPPNATQWSERTMAARAGIAPSSVHKI